MKKHFLLSVCLGIVLSASGWTLRGAQTYTFQEGVNGYDGTQDTEIRGATKDRDDGALDSLSIDGSDGGGVNQVLLRFDKLSGSGANQIPPNMFAMYVTLRLWITSDGNPPSLHRMLKPWTESVTWALFDPLGDDGISTNGVEAAVEPDAGFEAPNGEPYFVEVILPTKTLQDWLDGKAPNHGWALLPTGNNGVDFDSSESATIERRPALTVVAGTAAEASNVVILKQPEDAVRDEGRIAKFNVTHTLNLGPSFTYQWLKNGAPISGATSKQYVTSKLSVADNGAKISVRVSASGKSVTSKEATLTVIDLGDPILVPGFLTFEVYEGIPGTPVQNMLDDPRYPNSPDDVLWATAFDSRTVYADDSHENYGGRMSGLLTPLQSGDYEFFIRSDDASMLSLGTDDKPTSAFVIAEETGCCGPFEETGAPETSLPVPLVAGKRYYIQAIWKEGGGGDLCQVAWRRVGDKTPASQLTPVPGTFLSTMIPAKGSVSITKEPSDTAAPQNGKAQFSVETTATHGPLVIQWQKNGVNLAGGTDKTLSIGPLAAADNGAKIRAQITIPGAVATSKEVTLTVTTDLTPPSIRLVLGSESFTTATVEFSEAITAVTAGLAGNYSFDGGLSVSSVKVLTPTKVELTTSRQTAGSRYTLTVKGLIDTAGNLIASDTKAALNAFVAEKGALKFEAWNGLAGNPVQTLLDDPRYPSRPDQVGFVTAFNSRTIYPDDSHEAYGARMSGWLVPEEAGQYEFFLRSDDNSQLFLSTDEDPTKAALIAEETGCCGGFEAPGAPETSLPVALTAGKRYYIQALWKEGTGGDYAQVAWRKVGDTTAPNALQPMPGKFFEVIVSPGTLAPPEVAITTPTPGTLVEVGAPVTITASATAAGVKSISLVEFFQTGRKVGEANASPYSLTLTNLAEDAHVFTVRATDTAGLSKESLPITVSVGAPQQKLVLLAVDAKTMWRYDRSARDLGTAWRAKDFDDSQWPQGAALLADEPGPTVEPIRTPINRLNDAGEYVKTFYFRTRFDFPRPSTAGAKLALRHVVDDGVVFYLNGEEIHRFNIPQGPVDFQTDASGHENAYEGPFEIPITNLLPGQNVLAAEVHQSGGSSSDMAFGAELVVTVPAGPPQPAGLRFNSISRSTGNVLIEWTGTATLQSADSVAGPWANVPNAKSPFTAPIAGRGKFYRLQQ